MIDLSMGYAGIPFILEFDSLKARYRRRGAIGLEKFVGALIALVTPPFTSHHIVHTSYEPEQSFERQETAILSKSMTDKKK
jgi:multisubunit Na+/H+ antiporter MnhG subunit